MITDLHHRIVARLEPVEKEDPAVGLQAMISKYLLDS